MYIACLLMLYILVTSKVISGWVPTCDSAHSLRLYSAVALGIQAINTMTWFPTVTLCWHWVNQSFPYLNNAECLARKWQVSTLKSMVWIRTREVRIPNLPKREMDHLLIWSSHSVYAIASTYVYICVAYMRTYILLIIVVCLTEICLFMVVFTP